MVSDRAYLKGARVGAGLERLEAEIARIMAVLTRDGAVRVEPPALQPSEVLLDLYGEDIRARAFVTRDDAGEMMLRPDFTVPIVEMHMRGGTDAARYAYCGPVWRRQEAGSERPREFLQAGVEMFDGADPAKGDAEMLRLLVDALGDAPVDLVTGDMGLVLAAVEGLSTDPARRAALRRHVWRPERFHDLLERYGPRKDAVAEARSGLLAAAAAGGTRDLIAAAGAPVGLRGPDEIAARVVRLAEEATRPPLDPDEVARLEAVLDVRGPCPEALRRLEDLARSIPALGPAVAGFARRLDAMATLGIDVDALAFEAEFGRTTLEYYDGFVFGAVARGRPDLPPVASGGRYDALTRVLGGGRSLPAVGGILRPEALVALIEGAR